MNRRICVVGGMIWTPQQCSNLRTSNGQNCKENWGQCGFSVCGPDFIISKSSVRTERVLLESLQIVATACLSWWCSVMPEWLCGFWTAAGNGSINLCLPAPIHGRSATVTCPDPIPRLSSGLLKGSFPVVCGRPSEIWHCTQYDLKNGLQIFDFASLLLLPCSVQSASCLLKGYMSNLQGNKPSSLF